MIPHTETLQEWIESPTEIHEHYQEWLQELEKAKKFKERQYIDDPSEAPEGVSVEEGERGGYYYETEGATGQTEETVGDQGDALGELSSEQWEESFDPSEAESQTPLSEVEGVTGQNAASMNILTMPDGSEAYLTEFGEGKADPENMERAMAGYEVSEMLGASVPAHKASDEGDWMAVRGVDGQECWDAPDEWKANADPEEFVNECAAQIVIGNLDTHPGNIMLTEDGEISFIDIDYSGNAAFEESFDGGPQEYETAVSQMSIAFGDIFGDTDTDVQSEIMNRAEELAGIVHDSEEFEAAIGQAAEYNEEFAQNIQGNVDYLVENGS